MPSLWRIKVIKGNYYLYHYDKCIGPIEEIVSLWMRTRRDLNPGPPAPEAGALVLAELRALLLVL